MPHLGHSSLRPMGKFILTISSVRGQSRQSCKANPALIHSKGACQSPCLSMPTIPITAPTKANLAIFARLVQNNSLPTWGTGKVTDSALSPKSLCPCAYLSVACGSGWWCLAFAMPNRQPSRPTPKPLELCLTNPLGRATFPTRSRCPVTSPIASPTSCWVTMPLSLRPLTVWRCCDIAPESPGSTRCLRGAAANTSA